jgi:protein gp37
MLTLFTNDGTPVEYPQPQSAATFNETTGDGISWAGWSWNPVTGCLHGCDYCYARDIATSNRFSSAYPVGFTPLFHSERLDAPANTIIPAKYRDEEHQSCGDGDCQICAYRRVFVCSMADLYGRWVPDEWIEKVHASMLRSPQWQYILLTKFPSRYVGLDLPDGAWVGTSVDEQKRVRIAQDAFSKLPQDKKIIKWLSLEPLREPLQFDDLSMFDWVVIGAQTATRQPDGFLPAFAPEFDWVVDIYQKARKAGCKVHFKPNIINAQPGMRFPDEYPTGH